MIFDRLDRLGESLPLFLSEPLVQIALDHLSQLDADTPTGRYDLAGDRLFLLVQEYAPAPAAGLPYESHRRHADVQFLLSGTELAYHHPIAALAPHRPYDPQKDCAFFTGDDVQALILEAGTFVLFRPGEAHKTGCLRKDSGPVKKAVLKILLPETRLPTAG